MLIFPDWDIFQFFVKNKDQKQNWRARSVFDVETLELDVLYESHDIYHPKYCSAYPVSVIEINEN